MSATREALSRLERAIGKLEDSVDGLDTRLSGKQRDMFAAPAPSNANGRALKASTIVKRLDRAIDRAEELLKGTS